MIFETEEDRDHQSNAAFVLEAVGFTVKEMDTTSPFDFLLYRMGQPYALAEFKHRKVQYDPYKVDKAKVDTLIALARQKLIKPVLVVRWEDTPGWWFWPCREGMPEGTLFRVRNGEARGEVPDPCYEIPIKEFTQL